MAERRPRKDVAAMMGVGYHRAAFPATEDGGKRRVIADKASTLARISDQADELRAMEYEHEATIGAALTAGASWADIGEAIGMARQNAARKYARARLTYTSQPDEERARLDRLAGVAAKRITFEVWIDANPGSEFLSRHHTAEAAREAAAKARKRYELTMGSVGVYKVYPQGRAVPLPLD